MTSLEGAILVGGASRRMGRDKARLAIGGRLMVDRIAGSLTPIVRRVRVVGASSRIAGLAHLEFVPDRRPGLGPLGGIETALAAAQADADAVVVLACDLPFVTEPVLRGIAGGLTDDPDADAVAPRPPSGPLPVCAAYRTRCLPALELYLKRGGRSARGFLETLSVRWIEGQDLARVDPTGRALLNVNTPRDYEEAVSLVDAGE